MNNSINHVKKCSLCSECARFPKRICSLNADTKFEHFAIFLFWVMLQIDTQTNKQTDKQTYSNILPIRVSNNKWKDLWTFPFDFCGSRSVVVKWLGGCWELRITEEFTRCLRFLPQSRIVLTFVRDNAAWHSAGSLLQMQSYLQCTNTELYNIG